MQPLVVLREGADKADEAPKGSLCEDLPDDPSVPLREGDLVREWAPYMRWHVLAHFSGDPAPKDGKQFATGGLEIGVKGYPWRSFLDAFNVARLEPVLNDQYLDLPAARWHWKDDSSTLLFRTLPMLWRGL